MLSKSSVVLATFLGTSQSSKVSTTRPVMILAEVPDDYEGPIDRNILSKAVTFREVE